MLDVRPSSLSDLANIAIRITNTMPAYSYNGRIDCDIDLDLSGLKGKTAIVTGGKLKACSHSRSVS